MALQIRNERELEDRLSEPYEETVAALKDLPGDVLLLGVGGKMGLSLAKMVRRAFDDLGNSRRVTAVSRFSNPEKRGLLTAAGIETMAGDLLDPRFVASLPEYDHVVHMVGQKFGTASAPGATWATNAFLPGLICDKFSRSNLVAFSTGNVYPLTSVKSGGSKESDPLEPNGEYAMSAVARERVLQYFSDTLKIPTVILRLNYAAELRYGVLVDLAQRVFREEPISLSMGYFNCIWQGDANNMTLRSLAHAETPPRIFNMTGSDLLSCRQVALQFGELLNKRVTFVGAETPTALLSNARDAFTLLGEPRVTVDEMIESISRWLASGNPCWNAPTHFEVRDGKF